MSLEAKASESGVEARIELPTRDTFKTAWLAVRAPEGKQIRSVDIDGKSWQGFDTANERIQLPLKSGPMRVVVRF